MMPVSLATISVQLAAVTIGASLTACAASAAKEPAPAAVSCQVALHNMLGVTGFGRSLDSLANSVGQQAYDPKILRQAYSSTVAKVDELPAQLPIPDAVLAEARRLELELAQVPKRASQLGDEMAAVDASLDLATRISLAKSVTSLRSKRAQLEKALADSGTQAERLRAALYSYLQQYGISQHGQNDDGTPKYIRYNALKSMRREAIDSTEIAADYQRMNELLEDYMKSTNEPEPDEIIFIRQKTSLAGYRAAIKALKDNGSEVHKLIREREDLKSLLEKKPGGFDLVEVRQRLAETEKKLSKLARPDQTAQAIKYYAELASSPSIAVFKRGGKVVAALLSQNRLDAKNLGMNNLGTSGFQCRDDQVIGGWLDHVGFVSRSRCHELYPRERCDKLLDTTRFGVPTQPAAGASAPATKQ